MLTELDQLSRSVDGCYASDADLAFLQNYYQSFALRIRTYQHLQAVEDQILKTLEVRLQKEDANLGFEEDANTKRKCVGDTRLVLRYCLVALLLNDSELLKERLLYWLQTIMRTFKHHQHRCNVTYRILQDVMRQHLPEPEAALICPLLELTRSMLGEG
jgi:Phycobilisome protein